MSRNRTSERPRSRAKSSSNFFKYLFFIAFLAVGIAGFLYWPQIGPKFQASLEAVIGGIGLSTKSSPPAQPVKAEDASQTGRPATEMSPAVATEDKISAPTAASTGQDIHAPSDEKPDEEPSLMGHDPQKLVEELNGFYIHLDQQPYMQEFGLKEPSKVHFSRVLQKLIDNPPVVVRETDDLVTLLKNTAHFYRILDKENIVILKGILDRDRKSFEQIMKTFYALTYYPEYLQKEYSLTIPPDALQDYAAFFLNTIGGKLYLFRRDSASRMTVSYYAILVIDRANREGNNQLGIDIRPAIDSLIEEIENTGKTLKFRNEYLENLYELKEKYNSQ